MKQLSINDIYNISEDLMNSSDVKVFNPQVVFCVERAGRLIGHSISENFDLPLYSIGTARKGVTVKNKVAALFNLLPWQISHIVRKIELSTSIHKSSDDREFIVLNGLPESKEIRILLVDDAIDSGTTIQGVVTFLKNNGFKNIFVAVITTTSSNPIYKADYSHFNKLVTFPWSIGSKEYADYQKLYKTLL